ncbi:glycine/D-amino acid oxidase-like deaminating enzyme [Achromobacter deleyi]|uniref:NAD(P)/FAD-dependent oxidoreductase n=2 Tax=Alcaligenaceae TaxID=506 RepID=UPI000CFAD51E|nr:MULTISPECIES: FAD-dependent oxidoreductase [Achromobacter]MDR6599284.1 glycine/D-amino acid oxidase-like deaminating enzyme [Achromobacter deleyi]PQZ68663.1 FAD-dependent oxidoreductase [Achromobacter sp. MYb9]
MDTQMPFDTSRPPRAATPGANAYNPTYDPLVSPPGRGQDYAPTYWVASAGDPPEDDGPIQGDVDADMVIVGSGFTGLSAALTLARDFGVRAVVLEANRVVWGCTSRNGGQGQNASGRLYRSQWIERWGLDTARRLDAEIREGFEYWKSLVAQVDCDAQPGGHLYTAHRQKKMGFLENEARVMREVFGYDARMLGKAELRERYVDDHEAVGAMHEPDGVGVHPLKLAYGYLRQARALGVRVHPSSPVLGWRKENGVILLETPGGVVRARRVAFATGGYTAQGVNPLLDNRIMPVLSNSLVTRVLSPAEREAAGLKSTVFITDTRTLRFYYRLLPDGRMQIGSRSALRGADAEHPRHLALLREGLARKFPSLRGVDVAYSWWGWVDVSHDMMPRVTQPDPALPVYYAFGYGGNGVAFSAHAGRRLAERMMGKDGLAWDLPIYDSPLPGHLFAPFRRIGQGLLYRWYHLRDEHL